MGGSAGANSGTISLKEVHTITISNIKKNIGTIEGSIGGIVGENTNTMSNFNINTINIKEDCSAENIGGIAGTNSNQCTVSNINLTQLTINANNEVIENVGGIVGSNLGNIEKIKVDSSKLSIQNISDYAGIGMIAGTSDNKIENCIAEGEIIDEITSTNKRNIGGVLGSSTKGIVNNCYSNVRIVENGNANANIGGILGKTNYIINGDLTISNCSYTNQIFSTQGNNVGGVIGIIEGNGIAVENTITINNTCMNGIIPETSNSGAVIGIINATSGTINAGTSNNEVYYNKAYRWLGYASSIPSGVALNYNCIAQDDNSQPTLQSRINDLKENILNQINQINQIN